jgi:soluble cytochrome b562
MEEITLEKIDIIRGRTGISYREAKEALERNQGILLDTLIELDETKETKETKETNWTEGFSVRSGEVIDKVKALLHEGNVNRISIKSEGRTLVEIPVTLGALGAVVLPQIAALGVLVAMFKRCSIEVVRNDGSTTETEVSDDEPVDSDEQKNKFHKDSGI